MDTLAEFPPRLAGAVVAVLVRAGVPAVIGDPVPATDDVTVLVPASRRHEALFALAARMEQVHAEAGRLEADDPVGPGAEAADRTVPGPPERPLVLEQLRRFGVLVTVLVPLLVVALAAPGMPLWLAAAITVGAVAAVTGWRVARSAGRARARAVGRRRRDRRG